MPEKKQSYKEREVARNEKYASSLERMSRVLSAIKAPAKSVEVVSNAQAAVAAIARLVHAMPDDFEPPATQRGAVVFEVGQVVSPTEEASILYTKADRDCTVKEVVAFGGNADGKGSRFFLKVKRQDGTTNTVPASHFE